MSSDALTISLDEPLKTVVLQEAAAGGYPRPSDYVSALIGAERRRKDERPLDELLLEGLESGPPIEADDAYWEHSRRKLGLPARR